MYSIEIIGHHARKRCVEDAVRWFISKYLPRHHIYLEILHRGLLREGVVGWCSITDCNWRPREFLIEIHNRLGKEDYLKVLFHELHHVYQFIKGDLREKSGKRYWKGIEIGDDYESDPSEIEAHSMESILYYQYLYERC